MECGCLGPEEEVVSGRSSAVLLRYYTKLGGGAIGVKLAMGRGPARGCYLFVVRTYIPSSIVKYHHDDGRRADTY